MRFRLSSRVFNTGANYTLRFSLQTRHLSLCNSYNTNTLGRSGIQESEASSQNAGTDSLCISKGDIGMWGSGDHFGFRTSPYLHSDTGATYSRIWISSGRGSG